MGIKIFVQRSDEGRKNPCALMDKGAICAIESNTIVYACGSYNLIKPATNREWQFTLIVNHALWTIRLNSEHSCITFGTIDILLVRQAW